jgi:hypothetical protein
MSAPTGKKSALLDVLSDVKLRVQDQLGIADFPMPQFILIGSQSVGKSRLIECFAGEQFNFISGSLGSRRPTVLEFRNVSNATESKWSILDPGTGQWTTYPTAQVMEIVGKSHESLGASVSQDPMYVRVESRQCADMQIVDLPGYRAFSQSEAARTLAGQIEALNLNYLKDTRNVILCVEEAGDAANLAALRRVQEHDPQYKRTILVRNKLDKYYGDLSSDNVNKWLEGFGDLPKNLIKFAMTLPHWGDGKPPPKPLAAIRDEMDKKDLNKFGSIGTSKKLMGHVGYANFRVYMEGRTEKMFAEAIGPVLTKLRDLQESMEQRDVDLKEETENADPTAMLSNARACGTSFANCLTHVMEGFIRSDINRMSLDDELTEFHNYHKKLEDGTIQLPCDDFGCLDDYIDYLKNYICVPAFDVAINGGAQYRRLMYEVETFLRFAEFGSEMKKRDVLQSFGISMGSITWREVVVKLLNHDAHLPLQSRINYVGERLKWFFEQQKEPIVQFMKTLKGSPDEKLYSVLYTKHAKMIEDNQTVRKLVFDTYDAVVARQLTQFMDLFKSTLHATFSNPWVYLKKSTASLDEAYSEECLLPSLDDTKERIPREIANSAEIERLYTKWIWNIPTEPHKIDEAVDQVQLLVVRVYSHIRSQVCDQVELFAESFFKLPLMRRLEEDMMKLELSEVDKEGYAARREKMNKDYSANAHGLKEVKDCYNTLQNFAMGHMSAQ